MIEWGTRSNNLSSANTDYYWSYSNDQSEFLVSNTALSLILPAVNFPRMVTLNIAKSSLESPELADIYFYMNQTFNNLNQSLPTIIPKFNFQARKGLNIIDWQYSGSLHAIGDPNNLSGAIITVKTAIAKGNLTTNIINNNNDSFYWNWGNAQKIDINTIPSTILPAVNEPRLVSFRVIATPQTKIKIWKNTSVLNDHDQDSYGGHNILDWELSASLKVATVEGTASIIVNTANKIKGT